jgi:hypothetical protein
MGKIQAARFYTGGLLIYGGDSLNSELIMSADLHIMFKMLAHGAII